jgi:hypothetical protein
MFASGYTAEVFTLDRCLLPGRVASETKSPSRFIDATGFDLQSLIGGGLGSARDSTIL